MARRTFSSPLFYWNIFKQRYLEVFSTALLELAKENLASDDEDAISEKLGLILRSVCFKLNQADKNKEIRPPIPDAPIPAVTKDELTGGRSRKRPDFSCYYLNSDATSQDQQEIPLHVECKLLGSTTSPSWNLNKNYVLNGIKRFDCITHQYGKRSPSGIMIGYIINMTPGEIETEVNRHQKNHLPYFPDLFFSTVVKSLSRANQDIRRQSVEPVQFEMIHLWIDLRKTV